jgi:penicillin-binding protein 2
MMGTAELRNSERELQQFQLRIGVAAIVMLIAFGILVGRFFFLQVVQHEHYRSKAEDNRISIVPIPPNRGLITDRNGVVVARNYSGYTLEIFPRRVKSVEATIDELAELIEITPRDRARFKRLTVETRNPESLPIRTRLSDEDVAKFAANRFRYEGVEIKARLFRQYPFGDVGSHVIGYMGRINKDDQAALETEGVDANYRGTDYIGRSGVEGTYERELHGTTGFEQVEIDAAGRGIRTLQTTAAQAGSNVVLTIDMRLQRVAENAFGERRGALVAIEPSTGAVLSLVSKPGFDLNLFVDGIDPTVWAELNTSLDRPLTNRAIAGVYPPGSTFKPFMALAALNSGKRSGSTVIQDNATFAFGNHVFRSHGDKGLGPVDMYRSIVKSSTVYYYSLANEMGVDLMHAELSPMGFGRKTEIDLIGESTGLLPSTEWKRRYYKRPEQQKWYAGETISLGIGQGYNNFTMLQLASATATVVSGGQRFKPRLVREIEDVETHERRRVANDALEPLPYKPEHIELIVRALHGVTQEGTSVRSFSSAPYKSGGKTGTAQAVGIRANQKYEAAKMEEHKRDHSLYIAAAPLPAPTIALAVVVENAGFGSEAAAPIARRVMDYMLLGLYPSEEDLVLTRKGQSGAPIGTPRRAAEMPLPGQTVLPAAAIGAVPAAGAAARQG